MVHMLGKTITGFAITFLSLCAFCAAPVFAQEAAAPALTLDQAVQTALAKNLTLQEARLQVAASRARIDAARSNEFPQVGSTGQSSHQTAIPTFSIPGAPVPVSIIPKDNIVGVITARLAVYTGGRNQALVSRAEAQYDAEVARLGTTESQVAFRTRAAYYDVLLNESLTKSNTASLASARAQLDAAQARFEAGTAPKFDVLRAQTQVSAGEQLVTASQNQLGNSQITLNRILGVPLEQKYALTTPGTAPIPTENVNSLVTTAESQRSELLTAQAQVVAAQQGIVLAQSEVLPELDLVASYQTVQNVSAAQITNWTLSAQINWSMFNGGRSQADVRESKALTAEAKVNVEDTRRQVEQEVRQSLSDVQTAAKQIDAAKDQLAQATDAYDIASVRYQAGVATATELADALAALSLARTNLDRALFNYNIAYAGLQRALGRTTY